MKSFYLGINKLTNKSTFIKDCIFFLTKFCPWVLGVFYALFVLKLYLANSFSYAYHLIYIPALVGLFCVVLRIIINRPRPWQKYQFDPIDDKNLGGHSFPSIQVSLALSMTLCVIPFGPNMSILLMTVTVTIILTRILNGMHYLSDVVTGIIIALLFNIL